MTRIRIEDIIEHLSSEMRRALERAVAETMPNANYDPYELFRAFRRAVGAKCNTWENVPDRYVEVR